MIEIKSVKQIKHQDLDRLVEETYKRPYSFQQQDGCKPRGVEYIEVPEEPQDFENDSVPFKVNGDEMGVSFKAWLEADPEEIKKHFDSDFMVDLFWSRNFYPHPSMVINDLHQKGLIPAGEYEIKIDW